MTRYLRLWNLAPFLVLALPFMAFSAGGVLAHPETPGGRYHNANFGFSVNLDAGLVPQFQAVTSPDGITLTSPEGEVVISIFGSRNAADRSLGALVQQFKRDLPDASLTYEWHGQRSAVLSGYEAGDIFYLRITMSPDRSRVAVLDMIYAPELKRQLDPVVTRLSNSLSIR